MTFCDSSAVSFILSFSWSSKGSYFHVTFNGRKQGAFHGYSFSWIHVFYSTVIYTFVTNIMVVTPIGNLTTVYELQWFISNYIYEDDYALTGHSRPTTPDCSHCDAAWTNESDNSTYLTGSRDQKQRQHLMLTEYDRQ